MDLAAARAVLGIGADADLVVARRAYRDRARLLHPDRAAGALVGPATRAMAQLNAAWDVVRTGAPAPAVLAAPRPCTACSFQPASIVRATEGPGSLVFARAPRPVCTCDPLGRRQATAAAPAPVRV